MRLGAIIRTLKRAVCSKLSRLGFGAAASLAIPSEPRHGGLSSDGLPSLPQYPVRELSGSRALFSRTLSMPTARDADEAQAVVEFLRAQVGDETHLEWGPGRTKSWVTIYEVDGPVQHDQILDLLRAERKSRDWKPICVRFVLRGAAFEESLVGR